MSERRNRVSGGSATSVAGLARGWSQSAPREASRSALALTGVLALALVVTACGGQGESDPPEAYDVDRGDAADLGADGADDSDAAVDTGDAGDADGDSDAAADGGAGRPGTLVRFDLSGQTEGIDGFYSLPIPFDVRSSTEGRQSWAGMPRPSRIALVSGIIAQAEERFGWPTMPVVYFQFDGPVGARAPSDVIASAVDAPVVMVDIDEGSPDRGSFVPVVAHTLPADPYVPSHVLAVAPRPGFLLRPRTRYAVAVMRSLGDADGAPLGVPETLAGIGAGAIPAGPLGGRVFQTLRPAFAALDALGVPTAQVAAMTVFTTGDPTERLAVLSDRVAATVVPTISELRVAEDGAEHDRYCVLEGTITLPQYQAGTPPFSAGGGTFVTDDEGWLVTQREERLPIVLTLPREAPPEAGYPVVIYLHGTGGTTHQVVDRGPVTEAGGSATPGQGPAWVLAERGFATVGTALPLNPQRTPGAGDLAYITGNLLAFRDNIGQGAIEQRLTLSALANVRVPAELTEACGPVLRDAGEVRLDTSDGFLMGQSQGGHYANVVAALDPRIRVAVPTGAGGFQSWLILIQPNSDLGRLLPALLDADPDMSFTHPAMAVLQSAWEVVEPLVYMRSLHRWPIGGRAATSVYAPVAPGDSFYPTVIYDAVGLAYSSPQAGDVFWPELQAALRLAGLDGVVPYPIAANVADGRATAAIVQYAGDGLADPHGIFAQLDAVKHQYACFFASALGGRVPTLPAPADPGAPCP